MAIANLCALALCACATGDGAPKPGAPSSAISAASAPPLFATTEAAPDGAALRVFVEPTRLVGWVAGRGSVAGTVAQIELAGRVYTVPVDDDNTFALAVAVAAPTEATVRVGTLVQHVTVTPPAKLEPTAYFVVDRPAYRPGGKLGFAAFLRRLDDDGDFVPMPGSRVEVRIESDTRHALAAKLELVADANGRIAGDYTFSPADALDGYTLSIPGYRGSARVTLAEFRKPKVKLDVDAAIGGGAAEVTFRALDFLDHPVPGGEVGFSAQIVRDPESAADEPSAQFAYGGFTGGLRRDERLLYLADPDRASRTWSGQVVADVKSKVALDANGTGHYRLPIASDLVHGHHRLLVDAVIVDANGREQRTTRTIPLARADVRLQLVAATELVASGTPIDVGVRVVDASGHILPATASVAALRVDPQPASLYAYGGYGNAIYLNNLAFDNAGYGNGLNDVFVPPNGSPIRLRTGSQLRGLDCRMSAAGCGPWNRRWFGGRSARYVAPAADPVEKLAATVPVIGDTARLALDNPGAYRLVANARLADGSTVWSEVGVAVRAPDLLPPLVRELDRDKMHPGEQTTGRLASRYRDGVALVVVRDARGIRSRRRIALAGGTARLDLPVGATLGDGAAVEAYVLGANHEVFATQELVRVPLANQLGVRATTAKDTYGPGDPVELDIAVDRAEAVDLVVSVYDRSLLGVAPDRAVDPARFYGADPRVRQRGALATIRAELGDVTIGSLLARARVEAKRSEAAIADGAARLEHDEAVRIVAMIEGGWLGIQGVAALLRYAGVRTVVASTDASWNQGITDRAQLERTRLADLVAGISTYAFERVAETVVIGDLQAAPRTAEVTIAGAASGNASFSHTTATVALPQAMQVGDTTSGVVRRDFSDSAVWTGTARTDAAGKTRVSFRLPDSLTTWQVVVTAVARDTRVGRSVTQLRTTRDVMVWPMLPRQFTEGDTVSIFGTVHNLTGSERDIAVTLKARGADILSPATVTIRVPRGANVPVVWSVRAREPGMAALTMTAITAGSSDASEKLIPIVASSAEQLVTASGFTDRTLAIDVPAGIDPAQAKLELTFAPSLAADMVQTLDYLVEYPYGCAEQTMSRFAPAIKVAGILDRLGIADGALKRRMPSVVDRGMKRLVELQQPDGGWGWQGSSPSHEMITPYVVWGLLEAEKAGYPLADHRVLDRGLARVKLLAEQLTGDDVLSDRTYAMYVYAQQSPLPAAWWTALAGKRDQLSDYALALAVQLAVARGDRVNAERMVAALRGRVVRTGGAHWTTARFTRWQDEPFETTAAVLEALVAYDVNDPLIPDVLAYFAATKRGDRWNSTKDTAMVLYAMTDLLAKKGVTGTPKTGFVDYAVAGAPAQHLGFTDGLARTVAIGSLARRTAIAFPNASPGMLVRAVLRYRKSGRDLAPMANGLEVRRQLFQLGAKGVRIRELKSGDRVPKGAYIESAVTVTHAQHAGMPFLLVEDPKPAGAETLPLDDPRFARLPVTWTLREDRETHLAFHHEQAPETTTTRAFMHLEMSGELVVAPAQAELMYQTTTRGHSGAFVLRVD